MEGFPRFFGGGFFTFLKKGVSLKGRVLIGEQGAVKKPKGVFLEKPFWIRGFFEKFLWGLFLPPRFFFGEGPFLSVFKGGGEKSDQGVVCLKRGGAPKEGGEK